jgi:hypothetical protein
MEISRSEAISATAFVEMRYGGLGAASAFPCRHHFPSFDFDAKTRAIAASGVARITRNEWE